MFIQWWGLRPGEKERKKERKRERKRAGEGGQRAGGCKHLMEVVIIIIIIIAIIIPWFIFLGIISTFKFDSKGELETVSAAGGSR